MKDETFLNVKDWINGVKTYSDESLPTVLVGNKLDLADHADKPQRSVDYEDAVKFAKSHEMVYFETSAKSN